MADKAVIWDMDGVIVDTAPWHFAAWRQFCERYQRPISEAEFRNSFGQRNEEILHQLFGRLEPEELRRRAAEKEELFRETIGNRAALLPGVEPLLVALRQAGYRQGIGSSAPLRNITYILASLGVEHFFETIVGDEDVKKGKPDPEIFRRAAERLKVAPARCVVVEDSVAGVEAARAAGMSSIAVTNTRDRAALTAADLIVDSLLEVKPATIERLIERGAPRG